MKRLFSMMGFVALTCGYLTARAECTSPQNTKQLFTCAEEQSADLQSAQLETARAKAQVGAASQWRNPELSAETFHGEVDGNRQSETDIALAVPIEIGGKIAARRSVAEGQVQIAEVGHQFARAELRRQVILKLHRLRQAIHEREVVDEAAGNYARLIAQYARRPGLNPEQQVSLSVFRLAHGEFQLKATTLADEIANLESYLRQKSGASAESIRRILPAVPKTWPDMKVAGANADSPQIRLLDAEITTAHAELEVAQSEAWPTLAIGPSIKMQREAGRSNQLVGMNVSLPVPLFNTNGGARAASQAAVALQENRRQTGLRDLGIRREELIRVYRQSVAALREGPSHQDMEKRHQEVDRLFGRGVIPSSLVIESHRTHFELERARNERESTALDTLLEMQIMDGVLPEVGT